MHTEPLYQDDAYLREFRATVVAAEDDELVLDRTAFYPTGGGQPHDTGTIADGAVVGVRKQGSVIWHRLEGATPEPGTEVRGEIDWNRRHALMRTHTCLHVLCGVIWNEFGRQVTGGNMEPLSARMDFEFDPLPNDFARIIERRVNEELAADRPVIVSYMPRGVALSDSSLIRTKVNLVPESVENVRVVEIVGLDKQADGGTHVRSTAEVGSMRVVKTESKGKAYKRVRIEVL